MCPAWRGVGAAASAAARVEVSVGGEGADVAADAADGSRTNGGGMDCVEWDGHRFQC
jgi:hypothetical protein